MPSHPARPKTRSSVTPHTNSPGAAHGDGRKLRIVAVIQELHDRRSYEIWEVERAS